MGSDSSLASLRVVWLRGRARHLKIDMKVPISLAKSCRPILPSPIPSYRKYWSLFPADRPCLSDLPNGRRLDGSSAHPPPNNQQVPQSSRRVPPRPHPTGSLRSPRPPLSAPAKREKGIADPLRPASLPQSLLPASQSRCMNSPAQGESNAHTPRAATCQSILII